MKCKICKDKINYKNFGYRINAEEIMVCRNCAIKHYKEIVKKLREFIKSKRFNNILELRKRILLTSEKMGYWMDNGDKSLRENIYDYNDWSLKELQNTCSEFEIIISNK